VNPYAKPATISAGSSTDQPPAETTPATVAWLGKAPESLTIVRTSNTFRQLEWLQYRAGLCGIELKKEQESFPAFLALFLDITRYAEGDKLNRMAGAKSLWEKYAGGKLKVKALSFEVQDKIRRINEGAPEEFCPCGQGLLFTKPFGKRCSDDCWQRFCEHCNGPKIAVQGNTTFHQDQEAIRAMMVRDAGYRMMARLRFRVYKERADELRASTPPGVKSPHAMEVFAGLNGLCCRLGVVHGRSYDGRPWCTETPWCKKKFDMIHWMSTDDLSEAREKPETLHQNALALLRKADDISANIGPPPTIMVCEPCAAERKRAHGRDYVHELIEAHAAKRRRVE
jgi:hypothetical protein